MSAPPPACKPRKKNALKRLGVYNEDEDDEMYLGTTRGSGWACAECYNFSIKMLPVVGSGVHAGASHMLSARVPSRSKMYLRESKQ